MNVDELKHRFETPESYRWVPLGALRAGEFLACIDGRHDDCVIAGPGGDTGELIVLLAALELKGARFDEDHVGRILAATMDWHPRFYMHTDEASVSALGEALADDSRFASAVDPLSVDSVARLLQRTPEGLREALLEYVVRPEFVGCGHLQTMLRSPEKYRLRGELVASVMRGFFRRMWDGAPSAQYVVLEGVHEERAIVAIEVDGEIDEGLFVPAIANDGHAGRVFVNHAPAREYLRRSFLDVLLHGGIVQTDDPAGVLELAAEVGMGQLETTANTLAPHLPVFVSRFGESRAPEIRRAK